MLVLPALYPKNINMQVQSIRRPSIFVTQLLMIWETQVQFVIVERRRTDAGGVILALHRVKKMSYEDYCYNDKNFSIKCKLS